MIRRFSVVGLIFIAIVASGCGSCASYVPGDYGYETFYTQSQTAGNNVSVEVYDHHNDRVSIVESPSNNATVTIKTKSSDIMACGVVFSENQDPQLITIDIIRRGEFEFEVTWPAIIEIALPPGTNYSVVYTEPHGVITYVAQSPES